jgi:hypothetical protein
MYKKQFEQDGKTFVVIDEKFRVQLVSILVYIPPKRRLAFNGLHGVTSQKIGLFNDYKYIVFPTLKNSGFKDDP